jgi:4-hydroxy-tetrahydrodipicolinate reductase
MLLKELEEYLHTIKTDVIVDFSNPEADFSYIDILSCCDMNLVICSHKFNEEQRTYINKCYDKIGIIWAPNVTEGINILIYLARMVKNIWPDSDLEIIEYHFSKKKDISETALKIAETIADADTFQIGCGGIEARIGKETVIHTVRVGGIIGKHSIIIGQPHQTLTISHESINRHAFGKGALKAASWIKRAFFHGGCSGTVSLLTL